MTDMNSKKGKLIMVMGPPASGKSTLAAEVHTELKKKGINSAFVVKQQPIILLSMEFLTHRQIRW